MLYCPALSKDQLNYPLGLECLHFSGIRSAIFLFACFVLVSVVDVCNPQRSTSLLPLRCCFFVRERVQVVPDVGEICFGSSKAPLFPTVHELSLL